MLNPTTKSEGVSVSVATLNTVVVYMDKSQHGGHRYWPSRSTSRAFMARTSLPATERVRTTLSYTFRPLQQNKANYKDFDSSCTLHHDRWLLLSRLCLLLPSPAEGGTERLRSDTQPTRLFDDRLVYWECGAVNLDDILQETVRPEATMATRENREIFTFSRSILASAAVRVSRMRLTIHFSPSSGERLRRAERSLREKSGSVSTYPSHCDERTTYAMSIR